MPGIELGPWRWARECQMLTTRPHGMSIVQKFSSTSVIALGIPMPGIEPGPWRWKRQILIDEFHVDIVRAFFDVCKIFFQWKCIIVRIDCSKDYVGRHEFINDWNLGRKSNCFWADSAVRALKNIAPRIPIPGIELGPWRWERQILTTRPHGMSIVQKFSSTSVVALTFRHNDIFQKLCFCVSGESNPGLPRGRREFYHWTTNAIVNVAVPSILCAFQLDFSLV